jgi:hypothetical protein
MAFPHPQTRKDKCREEDIPDKRSVLWNFFERTINIPKYRNAKDYVSPAKDRTFDALVHDDSLHEMVGEPESLRRASHCSEHTYSVAE